MKIQAKQLSKAILFLCHQKKKKKKRKRKKNNNKVDRLCMNFPHHTIQVCKGASISYFRISIPLFCCPLFFEEYLNPRVRINKIVNKHSVDYHPNPSELTSRIYPLIFLQTSQGFISLLNISLIFSQTCISHHGWRKFSNSWCSDYWKMH